MYTTSTNLMFLFTAGVGTGILGALLGTGGGVFLIPILVLGCGVPMHYAIATSIVSVVATSSAVASSNVERGTANMRLGMVLEIATSVGAIIGGLGAAWISSTYLELLFALVVLPTAAAMWRGRETNAPQLRTDAATVMPDPGGISPAILPSVGLLGGSYYDAQLGHEVVYRVKRLWAGLIVSVTAGGLSGLLGIGGGVFKVPALHLLCDVPFGGAAATSNFMIGVTAAVSAYLYFGRGEVRPALTAAVVMGVLCGSALGSHWAKRVDARLLNRLFSVLLFAVAVQMISRALWMGE